MDTFTKAYIEAALWSSNDESTPSGGEPFDQNCSPSDIAPAALAKIEADCAKFQKENCEAIGNRDEQAGHDFWLTRCGHGAGFWDGDWEEPAASKLTEASKAFGNCDLYLGDDGQIWISPL